MIANLLGTAGGAASTGSSEDKKGGALSGFTDLLSSGGLIGGLLNTKQPDATEINTDLIEQKTNWTPIVIVLIITVLISVLMFNFLKSK